MGYTPRTLNAVAALARELHQLGESERADDGWIAAARLYLTTRTASTCSPSQWRKLLRIGHEIGLIERREHNPPHFDQRIAYLRVTEEGRKRIQEGQATGNAELTGQLSIPDDPDTDLKPA